MFKWLICVLATTLTLACSNEHTTPVATDCKSLAANKNLNDRCAIEAAKEEIVKRQGTMRYSRFSASFNDAEKVWVVMAIYEPETPGGHVYVVVRKDGSIADYSLGM